MAWSDGTVWIDAVKPRKATESESMAGTIGFHGVSEDVWNFHIGGYQVCEKWLKDRRSRTLSDENITHYGRIVIAIQVTTGS